MNNNQIISAGGIVFNSLGQVLIAQNSRPDGRWQFPKGHVEPGQTIEEAALREVEEETGIKAKIIDKVGESEYSLTFDKQTRPKKVTFFLMEYLSGDTDDHDDEMAEVGWYEVAEALMMINHTNQKDLLKRALEMRANG